MPLTDAELLAKLDTTAPTREQFDAVYQDGQDELAEFPRWSGRFTTLYADGQPAEVAVWGCSGD